MSDFNELRKFVEHDYSSCTVIEPDYRFEFVKGRLFSALSDASPEIVVKAGLGNPKLLIELIKGFDFNLVVVDPSFDNISSFVKTNIELIKNRKVSFINADLSSLPIDYFAADFIISIDYLDIVNSGRVIDEFRNAMEFESDLFIGIILISSDDVEGIFDDLIRIIFPLHNDYYLEQDLVTIMDLNEFNRSQGNIKYIDLDLDKLISYCSDYFGDSAGDPSKYINENRKDLESKYSLKGNVFSIPYYTGTFKRRKPVPDSDK